MPRQVVVEHATNAYCFKSASFPGSAHTVFPPEIDWLKIHSALG